LARENIRFQEGNFTGDGTYFYNMLDGAQVLQQKVDDGTVSFSYPLDTAVAGNINSLEWDGVYFWSLENRAGADGVTIRKWGIEAFVCKQQQKFEFIDGPTHTYTCEGMAIEHYRLTVGDNVNGNDLTFGQTALTLSDTSMLEPGDVLTLVRRGTSAAQRVGTPFVEQVVVQSVSNSTDVELTLIAPGMTGNPHGSTGAVAAPPIPADPRGFRGPGFDHEELEADFGAQVPSPDEVFVTKFIYLANADSPSAPGTASIYKMRASNGTNVIQYSGTQYDGVNALTFYTTYVSNVQALEQDYVLKYNTTVVVDSDLGGRQTYLLIARQSSLLFFNTDTTNIDRSMVMNNIKVDTINHWNVDDMMIIGAEPDIILYRLQSGTTYKDVSLVLTDTSWSEFNYEKQLLRRVVSSISVSVFPSIIPADGSSTAVVTAVLRDQYNDVASGVEVVWSADEVGKVAGTGTSDTFGEVRTAYTGGTTEQDVKVTATVASGLVP
jgi:hypothetical protein